MLALNIENKNGVGHPVHLLNTLEVPEELELLTPQFDAFLFGEQFHATIFFHCLDVLETSHTLTDGCKVGQQTT